MWLAQIKLYLYRSGFWVIPKLRGNKVKILNCRATVSTKRFYKYHCLFSENKREGVKIKVQVRRPANTKTR